MTGIGDLVLVYMDGQPGFFARIENITADVKPQWFQVTLLVLQVPLMAITWILREPYINGEEFTMEGRPIRMEKVTAPKEEDILEESTEEVKTEEDESSPGDSQERGKVVSMFNRKKKH